MSMSRDAKPLEQLSDAARRTARHRDITYTPGGSSSSGSGERMNGSRQSHLGIPNGLGSYAACDVYEHSSGRQAWAVLVADEKTAGTEYTSHAATFVSIAIDPDAPKLVATCFGKRVPNINKRSNLPARAACFHKRFWALESVWNNFRWHVRIILGVSGRHNSSTHFAVKDPAGFAGGP
eukprot:6210724-Pleurochrysis_carterae.AAC.1